MIQKIMMVLSLSLIAQITNAIDRPVEAPSRLSEIQSRGWYEQKARSWQTYLATSPQDKEGWLEYFRVSYYAGASANKLEALTDQIEVNFENSFEAHYTKAKLMGWSEASLVHFEKAVAVSGEGKLPLSDRILWSEITNNEDQRVSLLQKLYDSQRVYPSLLNYAYNVLMSISESGTLVVKGETMTIPLWILQDLMEVRTDVNVLNTDLAENKSYFTNWLADHQMNLGESTTDENYGDIMLKLPELNPEKDFFYGLTLPKDQLNAIEERLYVVGLASLHRNESFDHYGMLKENIEKKFLIDYLTVDFSGEPKAATGRVYEANYILPFLLLKEYYDNTDDPGNSDKWKSMILSLADRSQIKNRVAMLIDNREEKNITKTFKPTTIEVKELDKQMVKIKGNLYSSIYEITNKDYWFYLDYLNKNGYDELYKISVADMSKYDEYTASLLENYHYSPSNAVLAKSPKFKKNSFLKYPAIDMSFEAAKAYCEWLTFQYNQQADRKYKRVLFRLPTQKEWTMSAFGLKNFNSWNIEENAVKANLSGSKKNKKKLKVYKFSDFEILYPWWYPNINLANKIQNNFNCYLANVKTSDEIVCPAGNKGDGFTLTSLVGAYFPNGLGLYDVVGNVSEMIDVEGKSMGGSWNHLPEESTISSVNSYENSSPMVGFRLFMEVIEE